MRHEGALFHFLRSLLHDSRDAADVVNEAMFEVWRGAKRYQGRSRARTWLFAIARNKAYDRMRKHKPERQQELDSEIVDEETILPDAALAAVEEAELIAQCLEQISARQREVVHLAFFEDLPYSEIALLTNRPEGTVKTRMHHAKRALQHCLDNLMGGKR